MEATLTKIKSAPPMGEYQPTAIDAVKAAADFRILDLGTIRWKDGRTEFVTRAKLAKLQKIHTWATDFLSSVRGFIFNRHGHPLQPCSERSFLCWRVGVIVSALVRLVSCVSHCRLPRNFPVIPCNGGLNIHVVANLKPMPCFKLHAHL